jgi:RNA polymerase sigma factor (sigma-70 family)
MPTLPNVLHQLRAVSLGDPPALTDAQLVARFLQRRDEWAFETLVRRHGPMVLGVCRRVLRHDAEADDAFQATFLVLVRKASSLVPRANIANWLYGVAHRTALKARTLMTKRGQRDRALRDSAQRDSAARATREEQVWQDVLPLLDQELAALPDRYRAAIVLCDLEGKTRKEAARQLGLPEGTVAGLLTRGRVMLARRLERRGVTVAGGALAGVLAGQAAAQCAPTLVHATVRVALACTTMPAAVPAHIAALAQGVVRTMLISKLKIATAVLLAAGLVAAGAGWFAVRAAGGETTAAAAAVPPHLQALLPDFTPAKQAQPLAAEIPAGATARLGSNRLRHGDTVFFVAYAAQGKQLVSAARDQTVRLWDAATGQELRRFEWTAPLSGSGRFPVAVSPDGTLVAAQKGGVLTVWDTATGKRLHEFKPRPAGGKDNKGGKGGMVLTFGSGSGPSLAFSADNKQLLLVNGGVYSFDLTAGGEPKGLDSGVTGFGGGAVSADGMYLAVLTGGGDQAGATLKVRDLVAVKDVAEYQLQDGNLSELQFSPDGKLLAWCSSNDVIQLVEIGKDKAPRPLAAGGANAATFVISPDGKTIAARRGDQTVQLWDVATGKALGRLGEPIRRPGGFGIVFSIDAVSASPRQGDLAFTPDGKTLAGSLGGPSVRQFDLATGNEVALPEAGHRRAVTAVRVTAGGKTALTVAAGDGLYAWDLATGKRLSQLPLGSSIGVAVSADGKRAASIAGRAVTVWDLASGKELKRFEARQGLAAVALSPDGSVIAVREADGGVVTLWDAGGLLLGTMSDEAPEGGGDEVQSSENTGVATADLAFSADGRTLAGADLKRRLCLWDVSSRGVRWQVELPPGQIAVRFALDPSGRTVAVQHQDGTVTLYEATTGGKRGKIGQPRPGRPNGGGGLMLSVGNRQFQPSDPAKPHPDALAFSPDGRHVALAWGAPVVELWDVFTGKQLGQFPGHQGGVTCLAFTPDGRRVVSGSMDTTSLVWDVSALVKAAAPAGKLDEAALQQLWADLRGTDATKAFEALKVLREHPAQTLDLARAAVKPVPPPDVKEVRRLIALLNSEKFAERQKAAADLEKLGDVILPELAKALEGQVSLEMRQRLELLRRRLTRLAPDAALVRELRVVELLELQGVPEARQLLATVAEGAPGATLTQEAAAALKRMR